MSKRVVTYNGKPIPSDVHHMDTFLDGLRDMFGELDTYPRWQQVLTKILGLVAILGAVFFVGSAGFAFVGETTIGVVAGIVVALVLVLAGLTSIAVLAWHSRLFARFDSSRR